MIGDAPAFTGVVPGRRIGRGWDSVGPAVTHPTVHPLPAFPAPMMPSLFAQAPTSKKLCKTPH
ncbi:MAG: hypothetical protein ABSF45_26795, partial [Terriglobia bacterium]